MVQRIINCKSYAELDNLLGAWYESLCNRDGLCIAISRKAPRLLEWCAKHFKGHKPLDVVSEIALPFIDFSNVQKCSLVDEAIYHGTTYSKIFNLINEISPSTEVFASPLVVSEKALEQFSSSNDIIGEDIPVISDNYANFFVDTVIKRFHQEIKPYDMEYPLLYMKIETGAGESFVEESLDRLQAMESQTQKVKLKNTHYRTDTYSRETNRLYSSHSYVFEYMFGDYLVQSRKPNFAKLRITRKEDKLCVAVMTPYIISDYDIENRGRIFTDEFKPIWDLIYDSASKKSIDNEELRYQTKKSLVVMANFLLSYNNFLRLKSNLLKAFGATETKLLSYDIKYLIGSELADTIVPMLNAITIPMQSINVFDLSGNLVKRFIPIANKEAYQRRMGLRNLLSKTLSDKVSNLFSSMHWEVEVRSRLQSPNNYYSRLRFGESYDSLLDIFRYSVVSADELRLSMHRNIDSRIDQGSIVPNYVRVEHLPYYWLRLFRSGENEDMDEDQFTRIMVFTVKQYMRHSGSDTMPLVALQMTLLMMVYEDRGQYSRYFSRIVDYARIDNVIRPVVKIDGTATDLLDKLTECGLFGATTQGSIFFKEVIDIPKYHNGSPLSDEMDRMIVNIVSFVYDYCENQTKWDVVKIMSVFTLLAFNRDGFIQDFEKWTDRIKNAMDLNLAIDMEYEKMEFVEMLTSMPNTDVPGLDSDSGVWYERIRSLVEEYVSHETENSDFERRLMRNVYILNIWCGLIGYGHDEWISSKEYKNLYMNCFTESEQLLLKSCDAMPLREAKAALRGMIG